VPRSDRAAKTRRKNYQFGERHSRTILAQARHLPCRNYLYLAVDWLNLHEWPGEPPSDAKIAMSHARSSGEVMPNDPAFLLAHDEGRSLRHAQKRGLPFEESGIAVHVTNVIIQRLSQVVRAPPLQIQTFRLATRQSWLIRSIERGPRGQYGTIWQRMDLN
jgi:hypothetical protein